MKRSLGDKWRCLDNEITELLSHEHGDLSQTVTSKIFENADFGYRRIISGASVSLYSDVSRSHSSLHGGVPMTPR